jgi:hypothetical protein
MQNDDLTSLDVSNAIMQKSQVISMGIEWVNGIKWSKITLMSSFTIGVPRKRKRTFVGLLFANNTYLKQI